MWTVLFYTSPLVNALSPARTCTANAICIERFHSLHNIPEWIVWHLIKSFGHPFAKQSSPNTDAVPLCKCLYIPSLNFMIITNWTQWLCSPRKSPFMVFIMNWTIIIVLRKCWNTTWVKLTDRSVNMKLIDALYSLNWFHLFFPDMDCWHSLHRSDFCLTLNYIIWPIQTSRA